ncbi:asparagine synthase (glutamine-hydrolysing) [Amphibacillus marinus]|uniref:asparagine synthase (glutamine-hydrolyzing) n=1 Tax=Amphibacillus marinus TaxID=872970 RepID=A0A1H8Q7S3_9BACI|nr:asparagine synthase (glutamine-hydrolyzing) [Amphibacillus marinus]SEO50078.1 asparagine synthase (glutamine-hydrolysing) [Amphibacillus marinus]
MCGITGIVSFKGNIEDQDTKIKKMTAALVHRGPDQADVYQSKHVLFGHRRLIVVDPEGGCQPMTVEHNGYAYTMVYNGELYNTDQLRQQLMDLGWEFESHSDTEVLLKSYIEWREDALPLLNGIYAFAIWDPETEHVFFARDRLGVKPLFYTKCQNSLLFASEIKGILAHDDVQPVVTKEGLQELLGLGPARTSGHGVFNNIYELKAAHFGRYSRKGFEQVRYWQVESRPHTDSVTETALRVRELLMDAVQRQLVSDVPIGTFLSGGVDSSAITAIAAQYLKETKQERLNTFSIDFTENERFFQRNSFQPSRDQDFLPLVVEKYDTEHQNFVLDQVTLVETLKQAVNARDLPGMADIDGSLLWLCERTKEHVTVALSGECADEIFGGYPWFYREADLNREGFPWIRSKELRNHLIRPELVEQLNLDSYRINAYNEIIKQTPRCAADSPLEARRRELFYLNMESFMSTLLERKDRMSMAVGFEARVPFSDHHLIEYVWNIPWDIKNTGDQEKGILRKALQNILPEGILARKKSPYPKTYHPDYTKAVVTWMEAILSDAEAPLFQIFDRETIKELVGNEGETIDEPWFGQLMQGPQLLAYLAQFDYWLRTYKVQLDFS